MTSAILSRTVGNVLAVDTSTASGSLAIAKLSAGLTPKILAESSWNKLAMHSEVATLEVGKGLETAGLKLSEITHFAVNVGPGSFTGIRVGINLVRTLAYALDKPVATFSSLEVLAFEHAADGEKILIAIKAIQNFYYAGVYQKKAGVMQTIVEPFSGTKEEVWSRGVFDKTIVLDDIAKPGFTGHPGFTAARTLVAMSVFASFSSWKSVKPLYVRGSEAEEKLKKGLLKPLP